MNSQKAESILNFIQEYIQENQVSPTVREICNGLNIRSTSTVHRYLHGLESDGKIHRNARKNRSIYISDTMMQGIPLIDHVYPETALLDEQNIRSYYQFPSELKHQNPLFAFSMTKDYPEAGFQKKDILIAEETQEIKGITVFLNDGNQPEITSGEVPDGCPVIGTVISLIRKF